MSEDRIYTVWDAAKRLEPEQYVILKPAYDKLHAENAELKAKLHLAEARVRELELQTENLSAIVRRMVRYVTTRDSKTAGEKILELSSKCQHLLCETSPLKLSEIGAPK